MGANMAKMNCELNGIRSAPFGPLGLVTWATVLAFGWVLPNRYWPWSSFQTDYWIAACFAVGFLVVLIGSRRRMAWHGIAVFAVFLACVPLVQCGLGIVYFAGDAWLTALFLLGFALAAVVGARWELLQKDQAVDGLFLAIGMAAVCSVGMQLCQWLGLDILGIWLMPGSSARPYANFAQPNNLATFLLWGIVACAWGYSRRVLRGPFAMLATVFLVLGIALTQSRTGLVGLLVLVGLSFYWRRIGGTPNLFHASLFLLGFFVLVFVFSPIISDVLLLDKTSRFLDAESALHDDARLKLYEIFFSASLDRPWFGYGWSNLGEAFYSRVDSYPELGVVFFHSHNLFLDLILWVGWPIGLLCIGALIVWLIKAFRAVDSIEKGILFSFVCVVGWHAMVEFPLHYANFLLPCGFVMGVIDSKRRPNGLLKTLIWPAVVVYLAAISLLVAVGIDYFRVEDNVRALRFERANIETKQPRNAPELLVMTQLQAFLQFSRIEPRAGLTENELRWVRRAAIVINNPFNTLRFIEMLALNGSEGEARLWVKKMQKTLPAPAYKAMSNDWALDAKKNPALLSVAW